MPAAGRKRRRRQLRDDELEELEELEEDPVAIAFQRVLEIPQVQAWAEQFQDLVDRAGFAIDRVGRQPRRPLPPRRQPNSPPRPRPATPRRRVDLLVIARAILHFSPDEPLWEEKITKQRRALAALCHPDKGGSTEPMQKINTAADALLASLK